MKRVIEDFVCEHCSHQVTGNGYTNHCPECLWSKHVDIEPGDRQDLCGGSMEPVGIRIKNNELGIMHRCEKCRHEKPNKVSADDNRDKIIAITKNVTANNTR